MIMNRIFAVSMYLRVEMIMSWWFDDEDKIIQDIAVLMCEKKVMLGWVAIASPCRCKASPEISFCAAATPQHHRHVLHDRRALLFFLWDKFSYTGPLENVNVSIKTWHSIKRRKHHTRYLIQSNPNSPWKSFGNLFQFSGEFCNLYVSNLSQKLQEKVWSLRKQCFPFWGMWRAWSSSTSSASTTMCSGCITRSGEICLIGLFANICNCFFSLCNFSNVPHAFAMLLIFLMSLQYGQEQACSRISKLSRPDQTRQDHERGIIGSTSLLHGQN